MGLSGASHRWRRANALALTGRSPVAAVRPPIPLRRRHSGPWGIALTPWARVSCTDLGAALGACEGWELPVHAQQEAVPLWRPVRKQEAIASPSEV